MTPETIEIISGPSKFDLMVAIFVLDKQSMFTLQRGDERESIIVEIESIAPVKKESRDIWLLQLHRVDNGEIFQVCYNSWNRHGQIIM